MSQGMESLGRGPDTEQGLWEQPPPLLLFYNALRCRGQAARTAKPPSPQDSCVSTPNSSHCRISQGRSHLGFKKKNPSSKLICQELSSQGHSSISVCSSSPRAHQLSGLTTKKGPSLPAVERQAVHSRGQRLAARGVRSPRSPAQSSWSLTLGAMTSFHSPQPPRSSTV